MFRYFVLVALLGCVQSKKDFTGHRLISIQAKNDADLGFLRNLENGGQIELDFWTEPSLVRETDIRVPPDSFKQLKKLLKDAGLKYKEVKSNIQEFIDAEERSMAKNRAAKSITNSYLTYDEIEQFVYQMEADYGDRVEVTIYGESDEGKPLFQVKIAADLNKPKPAIWIEAGTHAREKITVSTALNLIQTLASGSADGNAMLANFDWYITPCHNPDGYEYTAIDRMWRKNRQYAGQEWWYTCYGTDLNRNWDANWGGEGSSGSYCSDTYRGTEAFSAPETWFLKEAVLNTPNVFAFFSIHSYSQLMLVPNGYTTQKPSNYNHLECVADRMMDALRDVNGLNFVVGTPPDLLYVASGGAYDFFFKYFDEAIYSYTYELRPATAAEGGFVLPAEQIEPAARETIASLKAFSTENFNC